MCGIVYFNNKNGNSVNNLVKSAYKAQRHRGSEGFGFFTPNNNRLTHNTDERNILRLLNRTRQSEILFHHRFPTSTSNVRNACHPFSTKNNYKHNYVMVHNGVIHNDDVVAKEQLNNNIRYVSKQSDGRFNDSEVLMYDIADVIEGKKTELDCEGSIAFIMVQLDEKGNRKALFYGRNEGNPLKIKHHKHGFSLTSEGDGGNIETDKLYRYDYKTKKTTFTELEIPYHSYSFNYYGVTYNRVKETDNKGYVLPANTSKGVYAETVLDKYRNKSKYMDSDFSLDDAANEVRSALMYDMNYATDVAIEFGELMLDELQYKYSELEDMIRIDSANTLDVDEYLELDTKIELLTRAIEKLANTQMALILRDAAKDMTL